MNNNINNINNINDTIFQLNNTIFQPDTSVYFDNYEAAAGNLESNQVITIDVKPDFPQIHNILFLFENENENQNQNENTNKNGGDDTLWHNLISEIKIYHNMDKLLWTGSPEIMKLINPKSIWTRNNNVCYQLSMNKIININPNPNINNVKNSLPNHRIRISFTTTEINIPIKYRVFVTGGFMGPMPTTFYCCQYYHTLQQLIKYDDNKCDDGKCDNKCNNIYKLIFESKNIVKSLVFSGKNPINPFAIIINGKTIPLTSDQYDLFAHLHFNEKLVSCVDYRWCWNWPNNIPIESTYQNEIIISAKNIPTDLDIDFYYETIVPINLTN